MNEKNSTLAVGSPTNAPPVPLSPEDVVQALRGLRAQMTLPSDELATVSRIRRIAHIDPLFVMAAINAIGTFVNVQQAIGRTADELRQELLDAARWAAVADELRTLLESVLGENIRRRQRVGLVALQAYQICQQLARDERDDRLITHIREMRRLNKFGRNRRKSNPADGQLAAQPSAG